MLLPPDLGPNDASHGPVRVRRLSTIVFAPCTLQRPYRRWGRMDTVKVARRHLTEKHPYATLAYLRCDFDLWFRNSSIGERILANLAKVRWPAEYVSDGFAARGLRTGPSPDRISLRSAWGQKRSSGGAAGQVGSRG